MSWKSPKERPLKNCQCLVLLDYEYSYGECDYFIADYDADAGRFEAVVNTDGWPSDVTKNVVAWRCLPPPRKILDAVMRRVDSEPTITQPFALTLTAVRRTR